MIPKALEALNGDRAAVYGHPLDNHQRIADFWTVRLKDKLRPGQVIEPWEAAAMMRLVKESRLMHTPGHPDSLLDIVGYAEAERLIHMERDRRTVEAEADRVIERRMLHGEAG